MTGRAAPRDPADKVVITLIIGLALIALLLTFGAVRWHHGQNENTRQVAALADQACGADRARARDAYRTFRQRRDGERPDPGDSQLTVVACDGARMIAAPVVLRRAGSDIADDHARTDRVRVHLCGQVSASERLWHEHRQGRPQAQGPEYFWLLACGAATRLTPAEANF